LNLVGILTTGPHVLPYSGQVIAYTNGVPTDIGPLGPNLFFEFLVAFLLSPHVKSEDKAALEQFREIANDLGTVNRSKGE
jgi:hypothetical protein